MKFFPVLKGPALQTVFRAGKRIRFNPFLVFYLQTTTQKQPTCCAIVISRAMKTEAVERNRIKRQIRPLLREVFRPQLGLDIVFMVLDNYFQFPPAQLKTVLQKIFIRLANISKHEKVQNDQS